MADWLAALVAVLLSITGAGSATEQADRVDVPTIPTTTVASVFAPEGLSDCDEMSWYRQAAGLPAVFDRIGWRESNCRNEDGVHTFCCHGWWQLYVSLHVTDHRLVGPYALCGVDSADDVNSDTAVDKWRQACAARALYDVMGATPWNL